jgi:hypothetical protein
MSIEGFVGQNIAELGEFGHDMSARAFRQLLVAYNRRVTQAELDPSLQIELPAGLGEDDG